ncbi:MAG: amino acid permease [Gemmatimonadota bacterium]|nr:amino acid permease [Gemmatimonadota bacterium]
MVRELLRKIPTPSGGEPPETAEVAPGRPGGLGTFGGVFTPSILTILGVIMYLRFGWVVGNVGLLGALLVVTLSTVITFLTGLSISAISTDQRVRIGGAYYMISRSLGLEPGGAIGIPLYFAQGLSVALYTVGFAESVVGVFPQLDQRWVGIATTILVAIIALVSARAAIRTQYFIMAAIAISLLSLAFGSPIEQTDIEMWGAADRYAEPFWTVFAVFFPAVTGIMAGVNMSGDLENPGRAIPRGTLWAIGVGYVIYMLLPIVLAGRADARTLIEDPLVMRRIAWWGDAILLGVWGATLSSAVGSILGAPRVLQALARDGVLPGPLRILGRGSGPEDTPRIGTAVTLALALAAVWLGNLNVIAPILTMFFLTTYGVLNIAAGVEKFLGSPSFRPKFDVHWSLSLLGAVGCIAVMLLVNWVATVVAAVFVVAIFVWLERRGLEAAWGDVRRGIWMAITRSGLLRLRAPSESPGPKNWRPHILVLSGAPTRRWHLIDLASSIAHNKALVTVATVLPGDQPAGRRQTLSANIHDYIAKRGVQALVRVISAPSHFDGAERLVEAYGLGALVPNTVLLGTNEETELRERYCEMIAHFHQARRNVLIVREDPERGFGERRRIDVWWGGLRGNGGLMMILAWLLRTSLSWQGAEVRLKMVVADEAAADDAQANLERIVEFTRTVATPEVLSADGRGFEEILVEESADADLVLLGIGEPGDAFVDYYGDLMERTAGLPSTLFVLAAEEIQFGEVLA